MFRVDVIEGGLVGFDLFKVGGGTRGFQLMTIHKLTRETRKGACGD